MSLRQKHSKIKKTDWQAIQLKKSFTASMSSGSVPLGTKPSIVRNKELEKAWKVVQKQDPVGYSDPNLWGGRADVRPSSFPFCARAYVMERLGMPKEDDFTIRSNHYTEVGKAVHYVIQNALARENLWGLWVCARPTCDDHVYLRPTLKNPSFYPTDRKCKSCGANKFEYEELTITDPRIGLRGHVDGILMYDDYATVLEVKTAGHEKVKWLKAMKAADREKLFFSSPWYGYWHQALTYATRLQLRYRSLPRIKQIDFFVQSRDCPDTFVVLSMATPPAHQWYGEIRSRVIVAQQALKEAIIPQGFCNNEDDIKTLPSCQWCSYKDVCLDPGKELVDEEGPFFKLEFKSDALVDEEAHTGLVTLQKKEKDKWEQLYAET